MSSLIQMVPQSPSLDAAEPPNPPKDLSTSAYHFSSRSRSYFASFPGRNRFHADVPLPLHLTSHTQNKEGDHANEKILVIRGREGERLEEEKEMHGPVRAYLQHSAQEQTSGGNEERAESFGKADMRVELKKLAGKGNTWTWGLGGLRKKATTKL